MRYEEKKVSELELCVLCGHCKSNCPVYLLTRTEKLSPRGKIAIIKAGLRPDNICTKCLLCECPVGLKPWIIKPTRGEALIARILTSSKICFSLMMWFLIKFRLRVNASRRDISYDVNAKGEIGLFPGCFAETVFSRWKRLAIEVLESLGYSVVPSSFACCGAPSFFAGDIATFKRRAERMKKIFDGMRKIICLCDTCVLFLSEIYVEFTGVGLPAIELVDFLGEVGWKPPKKPDFFYHPGCHSKSGSRELVLQGAERINFPCCGFGGSLIFKHPEISLSLAKECLKGLPEGSQVAVFSPGCALSFARTGVNVGHPLEFLL